ncbi:MAG: uridine diphosphate-N-acetylglucosamine-binding protein YvcK, partial [Planctomycetota bacterium]
ADSEKTVPNRKGSIMPDRKNIRGSFRAVIFDLDDTLYDCTGSLIRVSRRRAAEQLVDAGLPLSVEETVELQGKLAEAHGPHFLVFDEIGRQYDLPPEAIKRAYRAYNSEHIGNDIRPFPDAIPALTRLGRRGIKRIMLTMGYHPRQQTKIDELGLRDHLDDVLINDVDRGVPMGECMRYVLDKHNLNPGEVLVVGDRPSEEIRYGNELGMDTAQMLHGRFSEVEPRDEFEEAHYRINNLFQIPTIMGLADQGKTPENLRIVALGGGTGLPIVLEGCKAYSNNLTAVVAVTDSGRSSGKLREELGMLAPGDARNCLVALSEPGQRERRLNDLFQYRFCDGSLEGMSMGNLLIAAMTDMAGSFEQGIRKISRLLNIQGKVLPSTVTNSHVCAKLDDGSTVTGEVQVRGLDKAPIDTVYLNPPEAETLDETIEEISHADIVVLGPGSLYTSVLANAMVPRIHTALHECPGDVYYVCNIVTQPGQTDGFTAADHFRAVEKHLGQGAVDVMITNSTRPGPDILRRYQEDGAELLPPDPELDQLNVDIVAADLIEDIDGPRVLWEKQDLLRHNPDKLGDTICRCYLDMDQKR